MSVCPCCGYGSKQKTVDEALSAVPLGPVERLIVERLSKDFGKFVYARQLIDYIYSDDPNGGPDNASNCVSVILIRMSEKLAGAGLVIERRRGRGGGRRLVWIGAGAD